MQARVDQAGKPVILPQKLAQGGEGAVFTVEGRPDVVAKLYSSAPAPEKIAKLEAMTGAATAGLTERTAWPLEVLRRPGRGVDGFLMRRIVNAHPAFTLTGPALRKRTFPDRDWGFLIGAARSASSAFDAVHSAGHVIGDVNPNNIVFNADGDAFLIDCDSFQFTEGGHTWTCPVGVTEFQPPELQGQADFSRIIRTPDHDRFGLAVLIFELLFLGKHPFAGRGASPQTGDAIRDYAYVYGRHWPYERPPLTLPPGAVPPALLTLFERAFSREGTGRRPAALEWTRVLAQMNLDLTSCSVSPLHRYWMQAPGCPWCEIEKSLRQPLFGEAPRREVVRKRRVPAGLQIGEEPRPAEQKMTVLWEHFRTILPAGAPPIPPALPPLPTPSPGGVEAGKVRQLSRYATIVVFGLALAVTHMVFDAGLLTDGAIFLLACLAYYRTGSRADRDAMAVLRKCKKDYAQFLAGLNATDAGEFNNYSENLTNLHQKWLEVSEEEEALLRECVKQARETGLRRFLSNQRLEVATIPGIAQDEKPPITGAGFRTAADITSQKLNQNPGLEVVTQKRLLTWRESCERRFVFEVSHVPPDQISAIAKDYTRRQRAIQSAFEMELAEFKIAKAVIVENREDAMQNIRIAGNCLQAARSEAKARRLV
ncbi:helix-hairpin-helix domain-containing protein [Acetobacter oeni]|uniref:Protein kinase domain-containing protein n=1 Tax=Acetobacter oeni TaxID=304077 RepID=A0A511XMP0_9PROT|nr:hypothetical protein [Acetobacter oeni]MBB3884140.1 DNA-binding helix-hairpin-helix protein with protein kinase domain [Acetobacter oeni]NHO20142.1 hypothetical protein [Acetobacter oeni]GBR04359.1 hypothetical protein AA21952_1401 [Acetobacter oeni LMG 21952]GEN64214.1 hypothetical protein AOE01nite_24380 [Acetobacter oeni]